MIQIYLAVGYSIEMTQFILICAVFEFSGTRMHLIGLSMR